MLKRMYISEHVLLGSAVRFNVTHVEKEQKTYQL